MSEHEEAKWHLDRRVPLALIVTIIVQTGGLVWWASSLSERVNVLERDSAARAAAAPTQADRLTRVEVKIESIQEGVIEIKRLIRRDAQ